MNAKLTAMENANESSNVVHSPFRIMIIIDRLLLKHFPKQKTVPIQTPPGYFIRIHPIGKKCTTKDLSAHRVRNEEKRERENKH